MGLLLLLGVAAVFALSVCWVFYPAPLSGMHGDAPYVALSVVALALHVAHSSLAYRRRQSVYRDAESCNGAPSQCDALDRDLSGGVAAQTIGLAGSGGGAPPQYLPVPAPPIPARRLHPAVHHFGGDPIVDAVPRGALVICDPIAAQVGASGWQRFKWSVISRYGGPLSFALACEVHPDTLDQERWIKGGDVDKEEGNRDGPVVVGKVTESQGAGITISGQLIWHAGALRPHGYAIRRHACGTVYEGRWNRGSWIDGYIYRPPTSKCDSATRRVCPFSLDKIDFTVTWRAWDAEGKSRRHVRHPGPPSARRTAMSLAEWPYPNYSVYCGRWAPSGACATCICRFRNGDSYAEARDGDDGPPVILYYYIDAVPRGQMIGNCEWTILPAEPGATYTGSVFYPADVKSSQFQAMADYVLSGRSSDAFSPAQHEAFVRAIRAAAQAS
nr:hypothetical protein [Pandoravirus belohorizontensis]